jgi:nucleoside-diphosphate-sugar epimerase
MRFLVTGASGFLGWRFSVLLVERGHDVVAVRRPAGRPRGLALAAEEVDAGDPAIRRLVAGCDAVLHFAGVPDPASARRDPARAVRENAGTTLNLLEGVAAHGAGLLYPSTLRAAVEPPPDEYALSKRLGEELCRLHPAPATVLRLTSVFGPGQIAWEGATGAVAVFAARALEGAAIVIPGNAERTRDFVYVDDLVPLVEGLVRERRWNETLLAASGTATSLRRAAELVRAAAGSSSPIQTPGGQLAPGENESYAGAGASGGLDFGVRPLPEAISAYVHWLRSHPSAEGRTRA